MSDATPPMPSDGPLGDLARRLGGWTPALASDAGRRDRLLFEAGAQAGRRQARRQAGVVGLLLLVGLGGWTVRERQARTRLEIALAAEREHGSALAQTQLLPVPLPPLLARVEPPTPSSYLTLSRQFASDGFARLDPAPSLPAGPEASAGTAPILTPRSRPGAVDLFPL